MKSILYKIIIILLVLLVGVIFYRTDTGNNNINENFAPNFDIRTCVTPTGEWGVYKENGNCYPIEGSQYQAVIDAVPSAPKNTSSVPPPKMKVESIPLPIPDLDGNNGVCIKNKEWGIVVSENGLVCVTRTDPQYDQIVNQNGPVNNKEEMEKQESKIKTRSSKNNDVYLPTKPSIINLTKKCHPMQNQEGEKTNFDKLCEKEFGHTFGMKQLVPDMCPIDMTKVQCESNASDGILLDNSYTKCYPFLHTWSQFDDICQNMGGNFYGTSKIIKNKCPNGMQRAKCDYGYQNGVNLLKYTTDCMSWSLPRSKYDEKCESKYGRGWKVKSRKVFDCPIQQGRGICGR